MHIDVPAALRDLSRIVDRIAELLEWQKLAQQERRTPFLTSFELNNHLQEDVADLQAAFASTDVSLRELVNRPDLEASEQERRSWQHHLEQLEQRFAALMASGRFINS